MNEWVSGIGTKGEREEREGEGTRTVEQVLELLLLRGGGGPADIEHARDAGFVCRPEGIRAKARVVLACLDVIIRGEEYVVSRWGRRAVMRNGLDVR